MSDVTEFNKLINLLIFKFEKKSKNDIDLMNLDKLKRRLHLAKTTFSTDIVCVKALPVLMQYKEQILTRNDSFFLKLDSRKEYTSFKQPTKEDEYIFALIDAMRNYYIRSNKEDQVALWDSVTRLFEISCSYNMNNV